MTNKKYIVRLTDRERDHLETLTKKGKIAAYKIKHANILLNVDRNRYEQDEKKEPTDKELAKTFSCSANTVRNVRQRYVEQGLEAALNRKKQKYPSRKRKLDGEGEARLIAISCSEPPIGHKRWTLKMLANEMVTLEVVENISEQTIMRTLKKTNLSHTCTNIG